MGKYSIFNFTNSEIKELAKAYIDFKLQRDYIVLEEESKKRGVNQYIEFNTNVQDMHERKYTFIFFFSENFFECFGKGENSVHEIKESSNQDLKIMEIFLIKMVEKYDIEYIDAFLNYQMELETKRYKQILADTRKENKKFADEEHKRRIAAIEEVCFRVKDYFMSKKV